MPVTKVRAPIAMRICRMDRQKFNEAVADNLYPCAPHAERGAARAFDEDDLVALFYFARLTDMGIPPRVSGFLACKVREELKGEGSDPARGTDAEARVSHLRSTGGMGTTFTGYDPDHHAKGMRYPGSGSVAFSIEFNVAQVRELVRSEIAEEMAILGRDEDE